MDFTLCKKSIDRSLIYRLSRSQTYIAESGVANCERSNDPSPDPITPPPFLFFLVVAGRRPNYPPRNGNIDRASVTYRYPIISISKFNYRYVRSRPTNRLHFTRATSAPHPSPSPSPSLFFSPPSLSVSRRPAIAPPVTPICNRFVDS